jgi:hypothetical protein
LALIGRERPTAKADSSRAGDQCFGGVAKAHVPLS